MKYRDRSYKPNCPACVAMRQHVLEDWIAFHPLAGHGFTGIVWTDVRAQKEHEQDVEAAKLQLVPPKEAA